MSQSSSAEGARPAGLRVLVVDDDRGARAQLAELVALWGHTPVAVEGEGQPLLDNAIDQARRARCHVAIVDMRLIDERDPADFSGLELARMLRPTVPLIYSSFGDRKSAIAALTDYGAFTFVGKEESPRELLTMIEAAARSVCAGGAGPRVEWGTHPGHEHTAISRQLLDQLLANGPAAAPTSSVPLDQVDQLIGLLFQEKRGVVLLPIADEEVTASPSGDAMLRRSSRVFEAMVEGEARRRVVKLARTDKIASEVDRYRAYIKDQMPGAFFAELQSEAALWDIGGVVYNHIGAGNRLTMLRLFYHDHDATTILRPLDELFGPENLGYFFRNGARTLGNTLFAAYDELWKRGLSEQFAEWRQHDRELELPGFGRVLPNPMCWLERNFIKVRQLQQPQQAITHGDLHSDNLFVSDSHAFPIDFERTGYGPILRDFVELIQDLSTRVAWAQGASDSRPDLQLIYNLAVAWCRPTEPSTSLPLTRLIVADAAASKLHEVIQGLQALAYDRVRYSDQRELLWGLLLNHLFVAGRLTPGGERWLRTILFAAVICGRLDRWGQAQWPPQEWPQVDWR